MRQENALTFAAAFRETFFVHPDEGTVSEGGGKVVEKFFEQACRECEV